MELDSEEVIVLITRAETEDVFEEEKYRSIVIWSPRESEDIRIVQYLQHGIYARILLSAS